MSEVTYTLPGSGKKLTIRLLTVDDRKGILERVAREGGNDIAKLSSLDTELSQLACLVAYDGRRIGKDLGPSELLRSMPPKAIAFLDAAISAEHDITKGERDEMLASRTEGGHPGGEAPLRR